MIGVLAGGVGELVNEGLDGESVEGVVDGTPPCAGDGALHGREAVLEICDRIDDAGLRLGAASLVGRVPLRIDGEVGEVIGPGDDVARAVDGSAHAAHSSGAIEVVSHVVFASPDELEG